MQIVWIASKLSLFPDTIKQGFFNNCYHNTLTLTSCVYVVGDAETAVKHNYVKRDVTKNKQASFRRRKHFKNEFYFFFQALILSNLSPVLLIKPYPEHEHL